jgi:cysteine sulfinate desulfinase/cysteine desulfurase-like protein
MQMGLDRQRLDSPLRISFSRFTTVQEIDALILGITDAKKVIRAAK